MSVLEGTFQRALEIALNAPKRQTRVRRVNAGLAVLDGPSGRRVMRGAAAGSGDLVGYTAPDGLHVEIECKVHKGRLSPAQKRRQSALRRAGAVHVVVYGPEQVEQLFEAISFAVEIIDQDIETVRAVRRTLDERKRVRELACACSKPGAYLAMSCGGSGEYDLPCACACHLPPATISTAQAPAMTIPKRGGRRPRKVSA